MATSSHKARLLMGGTSLSPKVSSATASNTFEMLDNTTLADEAKRSIPGEQDSAFSCEGFLDSEALSAIQSSPALAEALGTTNAITYAPTGLSVGSPAHVMACRLPSFEATSPVNGLTGFSLTVQPDSYSGLGVILHDLTAETADGNGTTWDRGITSTGGGAVACFHTTAFSGFTSNVVVIEDSANNSAFSTIGTFTTAISTSQSAITISGTVRRYVRCRWDVTGTGSTTFAVSFAPL